MEHEYESEIHVHEKHNSVGVVKNNCVGAVGDNSVGMVVVVHKKEQPSAVSNCNYLEDKQFEDNRIDSKRKIESMKLASNYPLLNSCHPSKSTYLQNY